MILSCNPQQKGQHKLLRGVQRCTHLPCHYPKKFVGEHVVPYGRPLLRGWIRGFGTRDVAKATAETKSWWSRKDHVILIQISAKKNGMDPLIKMDRTILIKMVFGNLWQSCSPCLYVKLDLRFFTTVLIRIFVERAPPPPVVHLFPKFCHCFLPMTFRLLSSLGHWTCSVWGEEEMKGEVIKPLWFGWFLIISPVENGCR